MMITWRWQAVSATLLGLMIMEPVAAQTYGPGVTNSEIKIGQTMPYSGPLSAAGIIGRTELAYFHMINDQGGINGRRVNLISLDDGFLPPKTAEQTRRLVEQDQVLALIGSFGTPTNAAVQKYLTDRKVPQVFIQAGASRWNDPEHFPWTIPIVLLLRTEAKAHATYILHSNPTARVAILYQNDDFGKDYVNGIKERFDGQAGERIAATASYEPTDATIDSQIITLQTSGADTLLLAATPKFTSQAIRKVFDIGWHPTRFIAEVSASLAVLEPLGSERTAGVIAVTASKAVSDPQWKADPDYQAWLTFMHKYDPDGDVTDQFTFAGYSNAVLFADVLRRCGDELTREHLMQLVTHLQEVRVPSLLPGITLNTSPTDYNPVKQLRLERFDGHRWELFGDVLQP
jgi:branched-chain amino acid transport system substrate-binding protein